MSARGSITALAISIIALQVLPLAATADSPQKMLSDSTVFEVAYGLSFMEFDECGDAEAGRLFRRAIIERFEQCPFTAEARADFQAWRIEQLEGLVSELLQMVELGQRPDPQNRGELNPDGTQMSCADHRKTPLYTARRADLIRYQRGEIVVGELLPDPCDASPGAP